MKISILLISCTIILTWVCYQFYPQEKKILLIHSMWTDTVIMKDNTVYRISNNDSGKIVEKNKSFIRIKWDNWGDEKYIKQGDENTYKLETIPQIIHFVWLGSKDLPQTVQENINSWKKYMPDYVIKRWDESNCNVKANKYVRDAYQRKSFNYASDWCRLVALEEGGIYLDTDMRLKASLKPVLTRPLVLTVQDSQSLSASFMAVVPHHPFVRELKKQYLDQKKCRYKSAPFIWTDVFRRWSNIPISNFQGYSSFELKTFDYAIYGPSILMYDFGGSETLAEHLFFSGFTVSTAYYDFFKNNILTDYAYPLSDGDFFIPLDRKKGYIYSVSNHQNKGKIFEYSTQIMIKE